MKQYRVLFSLMLGTLLLVLAACGNTSNTSGMNMGGSPRPASPMGTMKTGTRMTSVQVTLSEYRITSSVTSFTAGTAYHFVVTNNGKLAHEFMIAPSNMMPGMSMDEMHKMAVAVIDMLAPGETKTIDVTFPPADAGKPLELACHMPGHYEAGMKKGITVVK